MRSTSHPCSAWLGAVVVMGCSNPTSPPSPAKTPASPTVDQEAEVEGAVSAEATKEAAEVVQGTITAIELHNINKALDHYTYNVELVVDRPDADPIRVRVDKIYWSMLSASRKRELAPDGPAQTLTPARYDRWSVGDTVSLAVEITSPGLAYLRR